MKGKKKIFLLVAIILTVSLVLVLQQDKIKYKWRVYQLQKSKETGFVNSNDSFNLHSEINLSYDDTNKTLKTHLMFTVDLVDDNKNFEYFLFYYTLNPNLDNLKYRNYSHIFQPVNLGRNYEGGSGAVYDIVNQYKVKNNSEVKEIVELLKEAIQVYVSYDGGKDSFLLKPVVNFDSTLKDD